MTPNKNHNKTQKTMLEKPVEDRVVPPKSIGEEEQRPQQDQDEPKSEQE
jgi:hypothetical protein